MIELARATDPETSNESAAAMTHTKLAALHRWAVQCVTERPGLTAAELAVIFCATDPRKIGRRLVECVRKELIKTGEPRKCSVTGRRAQTWLPIGGDK